jgi:hypothetical protein
MKKTGDEKSRDTVPLTNSATHYRIYLKVIQPSLLTVPHINLTCTPNLHTFLNMYQTMREKDIYHIGIVSMIIRQRHPPPEQSGFSESVYKTGLQDYRERDVLKITC